MAKELAQPLFMQLIWSDLDALGLRLDSLGLTWIHLASLNLTS
jgi:hypothetical protein